MLRKLLTMQGLRVVLLLLASGLLAGTSSLPQVRGSDTVPGGLFSVDDIEDWAPFANRTMIVRVGEVEYLFSVVKATDAIECREVQVKENKMIWLTHIGYMPYRYFTSMTPIAIRRTGDTTWESFVGKTHQCEEADCRQGKEE